MSIMPKTMNMTTPRFRSTRPTLAQFEAMLDFMESNTNLVSGRLGFNFTVKDRNRLWEELATILNSQANGAVKISSKWRKTWHDWKSSVKSRAAGYRICEGKRVRGIPGEQPLSKLDMRLLSLIGSATSTTPNGFFSITNVKSLEDSMIFTIAEEEPQQTRGEKVISPSSSLDSTPGMEDKCEDPSALENESSTGENNSTPTSAATNSQNTEDKFEYFSPIVLTTIVESNDAGEGGNKGIPPEATNPSGEDKIQYFSSIVVASSDENNAIGNAETKSSSDLVMTASVANKTENNSISPVITPTDTSEAKSISDSLSPIATKTENGKSVVVSNGHVPLIFATNYFPVKERDSIQDSNNKRKRPWEKSKENDNESSSCQDFELPTLLKEAVSILRRISRASEETALAQTRIAVANERKAAAAERMAAAAERRATAAERRATAAERTSAAAERASNTGKEFDS